MAPATPVFAGLARSHRVGWTLDFEQGSRSYKDKETACYHNARCKGPDPSAGMAQQINASSCATANSGASA